MEKKHIIAIDFIIVVGTLFVIAGLVGYARPLVIAPLDDLTTTDNSVLFSFEKADSILIDDNLEFSSPQEINVENNLVLTLSPGLYYWKIKGVLESDVRKLTIQSKVDLKIKEAGEHYEVVNAGNVKLNVSIYENNEYNNEIILDSDNSKEVSGNKFIGREHE